MMRIACAGNGWRALSPGDPERSDLSVIPPGGAADQGNLVAEATLVQVLPIWNENERFLHSLTLAAE